MYENTLFITADFQMLSPGSDLSLKIVLPSTRPSIRSQMYMKNYDQNKNFSINKKQRNKFVLP